MSLRILETGSHRSRDVDPFGQLPCEHDVVEVHITNGAGIGNDLLECETCGYVVSLRDLFAAMAMPPGLLPAQG